MASSSRQRTPTFLSITSSEATLLPESVDATGINEYLDILSKRISFTAGDVSDKDPEAKKTKIFNYSAALSNMTTGMIRYGIKLETDFSNLRMPMETTVRPPFESFRLFQSPENIERKAFFAVFTEQHCDQLKKSNWLEVAVDFISPQQEVIANSILTGSAIRSSYPESSPSYNLPSRELFPSSDSPAVVRRKKLPKCSSYWSQWKQIERTQWDFLYWFEHGDDNHTALKCWTKEDRKVDGVDANTYSNLKCIYNKFRDQLTTADIRDVFKVTKFEEHKYKNIKRTIKTDYLDNVTENL